MFEPKDHHYYHTPGNEDSSREDLIPQPPGHGRKPIRSYRHSLVLSALLFLSLGWNGLQLFRNRELKIRPDDCRSRYSMNFPIETAFANRH